MMLSICLRRRFIAALFLLVLPAAAHAQYTYVTNSDNVSITITGYTGAGGAVVVPNTIKGYAVTNIGNSAFNGITTITSVTIPASVTNIGVGAFESCTNLVRITLVNGLTYIGSSAFFGSGLTNIVVPNSVTTIGDDAFFGCPLAGATLSQSLTSIGSFVFCNCTNLPGVTIPASVTSIGNSAFQSCTSLKKMIIPKSVTSIGILAFQACTNLTAAYFLGSAPPDNSTIFSGDPSTVYYMPGTTGWGATFGGAPAVLWNPHATAFTKSARPFGFTITGPTNATIVVLTCTNLVNHSWLPVSTNTLSGSGTSPFSDPQSTNYRYRFYCFTAP